MEQKGWPKKRNVFAQRQSLLRSGEKYRKSYRPFGLSNKLACNQPFCLLTTIVIMLIRRVYYLSSLLINRKTTTDAELKPLAMIYVVWILNNLYRWFFYIFPSFTVLDASGQQGSGIFGGNTLWFGSYSECTKLSNSRYCWTLFPGSLTLVHNTTEVSMP